MLLIAHGGAGGRKPEKEALDELEKALKQGYKILEEGGSALDAVVNTIVCLEDSGIFNAGTGGNLQLDGVQRLDASLMDGNTLNAGAVIGLEGIKNPVIAARFVMDLPHKILTNTGAKKIAEKEGLKIMGEPPESARKRLQEVKSGESLTVKLYERYFSTVGAVALDGKGNLAAGSSTGGVAFMLPGRVGDTPIVGAGVYADENGAVSCTGRGEDIIRLALAKEICMNMKRNTPEGAVKLSFEALKKLDGQAGIIALDIKGRSVIKHSTEFMASGFINENGATVKEAF